MGWRKDWIARHKREIAQMREGIDWLRTGKLEVKEVSTSGAIDKSRAPELIAHYERAIQELEAVVARLEENV